MKRSIDLFVAICGLVLTLPVLAIACLAVWLEDRGPVLFRHRRVGLGFSEFDVLKIRTMREDSGGAQITATGDTRITRTGALLRRTKADELPQLLNVIRGDMSIVGPRPEVHEYVYSNRAAYGRILSVRPGIIGLATLAFPDEQSLLEAQVDKEAYYVNELLPKKIALDERYISERTIIGDLRIMISTFARRR